MSERVRIGCFKSPLHQESPRQLKVEGGALVTLDGKTPVLEFPDGTIVNVVIREEYLQIRDLAFLGQHICG